jgi:hypothetical protein
VQLDGYQGVRLERVAEIKANAGRGYALHGRSPGNAGWLFQRARNDILLGMIADTGPSFGPGMFQSQPDF